MGLEHRQMRKARIGPKDTPQLRGWRKELCHMRHQEEHPVKKTEKQEFDALEGQVKKDTKEEG
jgi:hypothetical protein